MADAPFAQVDMRGSVAGVGWRNDSKVYLVSGRGEGKSFLFMSPDGGVSWVNRTPASPAFLVKGNNYGGGGENSHPRGTGRLIGFGASATSVYVAGMDNLVRVNDTTGAGVNVASWGTGEAVSLAVTPSAQSGGGAGDTAWGLLRDPAGDASPWVSTGSSNGLTKVDDADGSGTIASIVRRPACVPGTARPAELVAVSEAGATAVYVAWGNQGIFRFKSNVWTTIARTPSSSCTGGQLLPATTKVVGWTAIDALAPASSKTVLVVGGISGSGSDCPTSGPPCPVLQRLVVNWSSPTPAVTMTPLLTTAADVGTAMVGTTTNWWHVVGFPTDPSSVSGANAKVGYGSWVTSMVDIVQAVSSENDLTILASGRAGVWRGTYSGGDATWRPALRGLSNTYSKGVAVDPGDSAHAVSLDGDWQVHLSTDRFTAAVPHDHQPRENPPHDYNPTVAAFDAHGGLFVGDVEGKVYYNPDPYDTAGAGTKNCWQPMGVIGGTPSKVLGIVAGDAASGSGSTRVVAAYTGGTTGLKKKVINRSLGCNQPAPDPADWTDVGESPDGAFDPVGGIDDGLAVVGGARVSFTRNATGQAIYAFSQTGGLSKSTDFGANFTTIKAAASFADSVVGDAAGWLAADPDNANLLYLSFGKAAYKLNGASCTASNCPATPLTFTGVPYASRNLGGLTVDSTNRVLLANLPPVGSAPPPTVIRLLQATSAGGTSVSPVDDGAYRGLAVQETQLLADPTGANNVVLAAIDGFGLIRINP